MPTTKKNKKTSSSSASASSASTATTPNKPQTALEKQLAEEIVVKSNIVNSMTALAKEAIPVSRTPYIKEDSDKAYELTQQKLAKMREEHRQIAAKQQAEADAKNASDYSAAELLGGGDSPEADDKQSNTKQIDPPTDDDQVDDHNDDNDLDSDDNSDVVYTDDGSQRSVGSEGDDEDEYVVEESVDEDIVSEPDNVPDDASDIAASDTSDYKPSSRRKEQKNKPKTKNKPKVRAPTKPPVKDKSTKTPAKETDKPIRKRKREDIVVEVDNGVPRVDPATEKTTALINMGESYFLTKAALLTTPDEAVRKFYSQSCRPGCATNYRLLIEEEALDSIRLSMIQYMEQLKYSVKMCRKWPLLGKNGVQMSVYKIACDLKTMYCDDNRGTEGIVDKKLRLYVFEFAWDDNNVERRSISELEDIIKKHYITYDLIDKERQDVICKQFYKKLPAVSNFTDMFMEKTRERAIPSMLTRLSFCLAKCRAVVVDAHNMGGMRFRYKTKLTKADLEDDPDETGPLTYKKILKIDRGDTSGTSRSASMCHTCGSQNHMRYDCPLFMNEHCNNTHCTWDESEAAADFRRIGHAQWKPNVHINGTITRYTSNPGAATYVYPTDDDPVDMGPVKSNTAPSYDYTKKNKNKTKHHHNNKNNNFNNRNNDRNNDRDNDRNNNRNKYPKKRY